MREASLDQEASDAIRAFAPLVRLYADVIDGATSDLALCKEIRAALTYLYAAAVHAPDPGPATPGRGTIELVPESKRFDVEAALESRLPQGMYWSALLPLDYLTVGDLGVKTIAEQLQDIYSGLVPGLALFKTAGATPELKDWWFGSWEVSWGPPAVRCMGILHEVITDLTMNLYGRTPRPS
jgi:Domain of unknown function (DUF5063)